MITVQPVIRVSAMTHRGVARAVNEDTVLVDRWLASGSMAGPLDFHLTLSAPLLCLVADGIGGHAAGGEASRRVAASLRGAVVGGMTVDDVAAALEQANLEIYLAATKKPEIRGMGSTVAGMVMQPGGLIWFNVGDSRIYRYRDGFLRQLSVDDVHAAHAGSQRTGVITQSLGGCRDYTPLQPHREEEPLVPGWKYLLCSDGLTDMVEVPTMERILLANCGAGAVTALFTAAMAAGGLDNITIILISVDTLTSSSGERQ